MSLPLWQGRGRPHTNFWPLGLVSGIGTALLLRLQGGSRRQRLRLERWRGVVP